MKENEKAGLGDRRWIRYIPVVVTIFFGVTLSVAAFCVMLNREEQLVLADFQWAAEERISALRRDIGSHLLILQSLGGLYAASNKVERHEFREFVKPFLSRHPSIQAIEWIPRVLNSERVVYEEAARMDGFPGFQITERQLQGKMVRAAKREEYFPVYFLEPYEGNMLAAGFDLASNPTRLETLNLSRDTGEMTATVGIRLVQETGNQFGFLVFLPVYKKGSPIDSIEERRENLEGFVLGVFRVGELLEHALSLLRPAGVDLYLYDDSAPVGKRFLCVHPSCSSKRLAAARSAGEADLLSGLHRATTLDVAGRKWLVLCTPAAEFIARSTSWQPWIVLSFGLLFCGLLSAYFLVAIGRTERIEQLVRKRTTELKKANKQLRLEIEERKQAEAALQESEEDSRSTSMELALSLSEVFEALKKISSGDPSVRIPETSEIELVTKLKHMVNLTAEELAEIVDLSHEFAMGLAEHFDVLHRVSKGNLNARVSGTSQVELLESLKRVTNQMVEDVSAQMAKRVQMEAELLKSRDYLDGVINGIYEGLLVIDRNFIIKDVNEPFLEEHEGVREDIIGRPCYEITHKGKEPCSGSDHRCPAREVFNIGKPLRVEHVHKDDRGRRLIVELYAVPLFAEDGNVEHVVELFRNITVRKKEEEEKKKLEARLQRAEKMEVVGTLAGGVAHDLNNILGGLVSYPELLLMDLPEDSPLRGPILTIENSGKKAAAIVQDLLTLARRGVAASEVVNLNDVITGYLSSPEYEKLQSFHAGLQIETYLETELFNVMGSPVHLSKTVMNLISNAAEAMPKGGKIIISTENQYIDKPVRGYDEVNEGDYIVLSVADSGVGIHSKDLERIFEPFYTKKVMGRSGTGLGMAVVWGTVRDHKGYIDVQSTEGEGTRFDIYFPVTRKEAGKDKVAASIQDYIGNGESILVVDDVEEQRQIASVLLTQLGYSVNAVASGEEAVEYVKTNSTDLLVLDMIMDPGIDGLDTYKKIRELRPGVKAIIASGFSETDRVKEAQRLGAGQYVKKPYTLAKMGFAVKVELEK